MRINPISSNYVNNTNPKNINFKGLWGHPESGDQSSDSLFIYDTTIFKYYPFSDETEIEIKNVKDKNYYSGSSCADPECKHVCNPITFLTDEYVQVVKTLPFTEAEYQKYQNNPEVLPQEKKLTIHQAVKNLLLGKTFDSKSAVNNNIKD